MSCRNFNDGDDYVLKESPLMEDSAERAAAGGQPARLAFPPLLLAVQQEVPGMTAQGLPPPGQRRPCTASTWDVIPERSAIE